MFVKNIRKGIGNIWIMFGGNIYLAAEQHGPSQLMMRKPDGESLVCWWFSNHLEYILFPDNAFDLSRMCTVDEQSSEYVNLKANCMSGLCLSLLGHYSFPPIQSQELNRVPGSCLGPT